MKLLLLLILVSCSSARPKNALVDLDETILPDNSQVAQQLPEETPKSSDLLNNSEFADEDLIIPFDFDSYLIKSDQVGKLNKIAAFLKNHDNFIAIINGHTDHIGPESYNIDLSIKRSFEVFRFLAIKGVSQDQLLYLGHGKRKSVTSEKGIISNARNRRVQIEIRLK